MTTANDKLVLEFKGRTFQKILLVIFTAEWTALAIDPVYRPEWLLENYLVFAFVLFIFISYKKLQLSDLSYLLLTIFMLLHQVGAHYGYMNVPVGFQIRDIFSLSRNPYDRIVHFLYGALLAYPIYEMLKRYGRQTGAWLYILPISFIITFSATYEIIEAMVAWVLPEKEYDPFVGMQGDIWDGYKDMLAAAVGAIISTTFILCSDLRNKNKS
ncbi:MAG: hypothetical protein A2V66_12070 [Ignavibacteria bacterium RBG_13_36_8]|nr:MAG: hypothetical protein A2V66_12070 [Ignavibacteria bacterium RBG_13_36_8]